jgi:hypothetical protein
LQVLLEALLGRERDLDFAETEIVGHRGRGERSEVRGQGPGRVMRPGCVNAY